MNEEQLEQTALDLLEELGWETVDAFDESFGGQGTLGRDSFTEPVLGHRLIRSLRALNPDIPDESLGVAVDELTRSRAVMEPVRANQEIYGLLRNGFVVSVEGDDEIAYLGESLNLFLDHLEDEQDRNA